MLRKIAGSNFEGLNSINFLNIYDNVQLIRPLIYYSKKEILLFNKKHNIPYINDPKQLGFYFSRNTKTIFFVLIFFYLSYQGLQLFWESLKVIVNNLL